MFFMVSKIYFFKLATNKNKTKNYLSNYIFFTLNIFINATVKNRTEYLFFI